MDANADPVRPPESGEPSDLSELDRRAVRVFAIVDLLCALYLLVVFVGAVFLDILPLAAMDFEGVELTRFASVAKAVQLYTLIPLSGALFALTIVVALRQRPRIIAAAAFGVFGSGMLLFACTMLVPWARNQGWGPYLTGNALILGGMLAHAALGVRLWRATMAPAA